MIWDVDIARRLRHGDASFELQVAFESTAERLVLFGPSGAGKTQTLKLLAGIAAADRGHVRIAGRTLFARDEHGTPGKRGERIDLSPQQRRLGYVFQDYALFPHLTVRQNIAFALRSGWLNPPRGVRAEAVERWIASFHLGSVAEHFPHQISGGQRQRTALARALVNAPTALLLDEPFAALDKGLRRELRAELAALQRELKIPMLLITHDDDDLAALADGVLHISGGRLVGGAAGGPVPPTSPAPPSSPAAP